MFIFDASTKMAKVGKISNFFVQSQGPQMPLSDLLMKKEIQCGHKILRLNWFVVHLNKYELILTYAYI